MNFFRVEPRRLLLSIAALGLIAGGASAESTLQAVAATEPAAASDVDRFCKNIADAARDRRYAVQAEELKKLQGEIDLRVAALEKKRAEYQDWLSRREAFLDKAEDGVVEIYSTMKPDAAAERLAELKSGLAAAILMKLDRRKAGTILNEMDSKQAASLTAVMATVVRREDPS